MARCACGGDTTCACLVVAAPNTGVEVTGRGTTSDPYVIGLFTGLPGFSVTDTDTVDLSLIGAIGENETPVLSANATIAMSDLTDVVDTTPPVDGDIPTWVTDHWEFLPAGASLPPGGADGQVLTKQSATDGDADWETLPAGVTPPPPSGVWGTAPLDAATYGADSLIGREVYLDSAGKLRAKPDLMPLKAVTDLGSAYPTGTSIFYLFSGAQTTPWPPAGATAATVVTTKSTSTTSYGVTQWCYSATAGTTRAWVRTGTNAAWNAWVEVTASSPAPRTLRRKSASQALTVASTWYTITFDVDEGNGTGIAYSGGVFTVPEAAVYLINPLVLVQGPGAPTIRVRIVAAGLNLGEETVIGGSGNNTFTQSRSVRLAAGETIYMEAQSTLTGLSVTGSTPKYTMIDITRISA